MLPRWLTALPRFAATWRDEIAVVALGLAYQAGAVGTLGAPRAAHSEAERVVVRIAAEGPRASIVTTDVTMERAIAHGRARTAVAPHLTPAHVARLRAMATTVERAPSAPAPARARRTIIAPAAPAAPAARAAIVVTSEAGENVAADVAAGMEVSGIVIDTCTLPEIRASIARARAAMDESRVRAALQKALAAERSLPRAFQGPGA